MNTSDMKITRKKLIFLDFTVVNSQTNKYEFKVYRNLLFQVYKSKRIQIFAWLYHWHFQRTPFMSFQQMFTKIFWWRNHISEWYIYWKWTLENRTGEKSTRIPKYYHEKHWWNKALLNDHGYQNLDQNWEASFVKFILFYFILFFFVDGGLKKLYVTNNCFLFQLFTKFLSWRIIEIWKILRWSHGKSPNHIILHNLPPIMHL